MRKNMTDEERQLAELLSRRLTTDFEAQVVVNFAPRGILVHVEELGQSRELAWSWADVAKALTQNL